MTAQLDAPVLDSGKLEEFAGKVAGDQAALLGWLAVTATPAYRQATERLARRTRVTPLDA